MIKAKEFWTVLCDDLNYRFFSGVACGGFKSIFKFMSPEFMHYVPAVNERTALNLCSGVAIGGFKSAILISDLFLSDLITPLLDLNLKYKIPVLIIAYSESNRELPISIPKVEITQYNFDDFKNYMHNIDLKIQKSRRPGLVHIGEGVLS